MPTKIEWCDETLNPFGWGCYGPGGTPEKPNRCPECYAYRLAKRNLRTCPKCRAFKPHWHPEQLDSLPEWKKPRVIFMQDMGDMWHKIIPAWLIRAILAAEKTYPQHTYLHLTKNPARYIELHPLLPKKNAWYGVTIRNQPEADILIPIILQLAALGFKVFVSLEPMKGPVDISKYLCSQQCEDWGLCHGKRRDECAYPGISAVIVGGESGPNARPVHPDWVRSIRDQCAAAGVPFFVKQIHVNGKTSKNMDEWPADLRVRELPWIK